MKLLLIITSYIVAILFSIFGQHIAYFLTDFLPFKPFPILIALTVMSYVLFIGSISYYMFNWKKQHPAKFNDFIIAALIIVALPVMGLSFIILAFWAG